MRRVQGRALQCGHTRGHHPWQDIDDILNMPVEEGFSFFAKEPVIGKKIEVLNDLGLGYLTLGQSATTLSGGEAQRIKIAAELSKLQRSKHTLYILDEPTTGLHLHDVEKPNVTAENAPKAQRLDVRLSKTTSSFTIMYLMSRSCASGNPFMRSLNRSFDTIEAASSRANINMK